MRSAPAILLLLLLVPETPAQQSASHTLEEHVVNAGGHPQFGSNPASASHRLTLGSIGDPFGISRSFGSTFVLDGGFIAAYPPPTEVGNLRFADDTTLVWDAHAAAGRYDVYRDALSALRFLGYGACAQQNLSTPTATDAVPVPPGNGFFFLVTVENRLHEEGSKGFQSNGTARTGAVCP